MRALTELIIKLALFAFFLLVNYSCENESTIELNDDIGNEQLSELIIGTWAIYDIKILDIEFNEITFPEYLSIECDSKTKYIFSADGDFEILNRTSYRQIHNSQNELERFECVPNDEGGGFKSGSWEIKFDENGVEILDIDWIYNKGTTTTDGVLWQPNFLNETSFLLSDFVEYEEQYYQYYYKKID